jgi:hypothetical protein
MFKTFFLLFFLLESLTSFSQKTEVVFCADFSGSTNGMVKELQKTIWATVNQFQAVNSNRELSFGLVGYGRKSFDKENYYSKVIHSLGTPVNDIGYSLVKLQVVVNGCDAYPQKALNYCVRSITWSEAEDVKRVIVLIGNGGVAREELKKELKRAKKLNIFVQPIFYKANRSGGSIEDWKFFAKEAGTTLIISEAFNFKIEFKKYYDSSFIMDAGEKYLSTFVPYGIKGNREFSKMKKMFSKLKETAVDNFEEMLVFQSSKNMQSVYGSWDLIDFSKSNDIANLNRKEIPLFLKSFSSEELNKYLLIKRDERVVIVEKIRLELVKRNEFITRRRLKSKNFQGKGGLSNIIVEFLLDKFN